MKFEIIWTNLHKKIIDADSYEEAKKIVEEELDSTEETYQECINQEIIPL